MATVTIFRKCEIKRDLTYLVFHKEVATAEGIQKIVGSLNVSKIPFIVNEGDTIEIPKGVDDLISWVKKDSKNKATRYNSRCFSCKQSIKAPENEYCPLCLRFKCNNCGKCFCDFV